MLLGLGRIPTEDTRNANYPVSKSGVLPAKESKRKVRYWNEGRKSRGQVNQGSVPACVGAGWVHYLINGPVTRKIGEIPTFMELYRRAQQLDEWEGEAYAGTSVLGGAKAVQERGLIGNYWWTEDINEVVQILLEVGPIVVGTLWFAGMSYPDKKGRIKIAGAMEGGHCYLINGINLETEETRAEQSWYPSWGDTGNFWPTLRQLETLISYGAEICIATELKK